MFEDQVIQIGKYYCFVYFHDACSSESFAKYCVLNRILLVMWKLTLQFVVYPMDIQDKLMNQRLLELTENLEESDCNLSFYLTFK